ncbi:hypothetical protein AnigIFM63604_006514 [Aspergillus niger]|uniref:Uncharacterized protein n=1 Tax=Aspergillus niger TaxID=5061 RepID=A0A9W6E976_ASPNG|nr:hypothetical protein CBS11350_8835 [Aspergillus niger]KAI2935074.1 hypothetical protein CBS147320_808 [Aspergillus niger]KAI2963302.1 hypothetical protein CBS147324_9057 [Aspergillus niger]KAI2989941.1 hypothetical protein CBS147482_9210 [Aspergillus niger]KAI3050770.1 hypothetical protein CBS147352_5233 [Aspergillus niger]
MQTGIFGPNLYSLEHGEETEKGLVADILAIPELRKSWIPDVGPRLFHSKSAVGCYDKHMKPYPMEESLAWTRSLMTFPDIPRPLKAPPRSGMIPRGRVNLRSMAETFDVPDTPFWNAAAEQTYGYIWCMEDDNLICKDCVRGTSSVGVLATFPDYYHFCQELYPVLELSAKRTVEFINHVHRCHPNGEEDHKVMDAWLATVQAIYLDVLHPKADSLKCPADELQSIRYRLVNSGVRALTLQARLERGPLIGDDVIVDAVSIAMITMHDACDYRHDNQANEFYNIMTIVSAHRGVPGTNMIRRFCIDVWAWAVDNGADWAIHLAGRLLAWQLYMARYRTPILFDHLVPADANNQPKEDPYGDPILNSMNPLPPSSQPYDFDLRNRCGNKERYDELLRDSLAHFETCSGCHQYDKVSWESRVPFIGRAYEKKYSDCTCLNAISTYMILACMEPVWWAMDYAAEYTGPMEEWSPMLC